MRSAGALVLFASVFLGACNSSDGSPGGRPVSPTPPAASVGVVIEAVRTMPFGAEIRALGTAFANQSIDVTAKVTNTIVALHFDEGAEVKRGAVLVELDRAQAAADLDIAEAALDETERQYKRGLDLFSTRALSQANLDQLVATLKGNRARVASARARLSDMTIRAPFGGRTGFHRVSIGSLVSPGDVITTLDDTQSIKLDFTVPEPSMPLVKPGLPIVAQSVAMPGQSFTGKIETLGSRIDPVTRSVTVRALLPNTSGVLRPGMFMNVVLAGARRDAIVVPEQALVSERGSVFVFVVGDDSLARRREVRAGGRDVGRVEVVSGLAVGERIVVDGLLKLRDGLPVHDVPPIVGDKPMSVPNTAPNARLGARLGAGSGG
jgi:membrane fusion protein (multidrug efflux system)